MPPCPDCHSRGVVLVRFLGRIVLALWIVSLAVPLSTGIRSCSSAVTDDWALSFHHAAVQWLAADAAGTTIHDQRDFPTKSRARILARARIGDRHKQCDGTFASRNRVCHRDRRPPLRRHTGSRRGREHDLHEQCMG